MRASKGMNTGCLEGNGNGVLMRVYRELDPQKERKRKSSLTWAPAVIWNCTRRMRNITKPLKSKMQELRICVYVCNNKALRKNPLSICVMEYSILNTVYSILQTSYTRNVFNSSTCMLHYCRMASSH